MESSTTSDRTVLLINPGGLIPMRGGGSARTWSLIGFLRANGFRAELVTGHHLEHQEEVRARVDRLWTRGLGGGKPPAEPLPKKPAVRPSATGPGSFIQRSRRKGLELLAGRVAYRRKPLAAIATYAWMAPALDRMPPGTLRILDTIDVQHVRAETAQRGGGNLSYIDCTREEEIIELRRADVLLAIQSEDREKLKELCPDRRVCLVKHAFLEVKRPKSPTDSREILFVGNLYNPNVVGFRTFLEKVWPDIRNALPDARLMVCGRVHEAFTEKIAGVKFEGIVPDLDPYYARAALVVNPIPYGTGLKIKSLEALSHGKAIVTTRSGVLGLDLPATPPLVISSLEKMASEVVRLLSDATSRRRLENAASEFVDAHYRPETVYAELLGILGAHRDS